MYGDPKPVEDVLEQQRDDAPEEYDDRAIAELPAEADEADHADQHIAVPVEDDRYPDG